MTNNNGNERPEPLKVVLAVLGGLVGASAWVALVGAMVMIIRFDALNVSPYPTVSLIPDEQRLLVGARFVVPALLAATLAFIGVLLDRPRTESERRRNDPGHLPRGFWSVGAVWLAVAFLVAIVSEAAPVAVRSAIAVGALAFIALAGLTIRATEGFTTAGSVLFAAVALYAGASGLVYEATRDTRLDLAAVIRTDGSVAAGYYVSSSDKRVLLVSALQPLRTASPARRRQPPARLDPRADRCTEDRAVSNLTLGADCYYIGLVSVPDEQVAKLVLGPPAVRVGASGFNAARALARRARQRTDELPATPTPQPAPGGSPSSSP